jgi:hypothetical protein
LGLQTPEKHAFGPELPKNSSNIVPKHPFSVLGDPVCLHLKKNHVSSMNHLKIHQNMAKTIFSPF